MYCKELISGWHPAMCLLVHNSHVNPWKSGLKPLSPGLKSKERISRPSCRSCCGTFQGRCTSVATDSHTDPYNYTPGTGTKEIMYPSPLHQLIDRAAESDSSCRTAPTDNIYFSEVSSRYCKPDTDWAVTAFTGLLFMFLMPSLYVKRRMLKGRQEV